MATPSPEPAPLEPVAVPAPAMPTGPACVACGGEAVVNWRRRPTGDELAELVAAEKARRVEVLRLADPQLPEPVFPALPSGEGMTRTVYACAGHAITMDAASHIHASSCTAPNEDDLPGCDCTPEPLPESEPDATAPTERRLPAHWVTGGQ